MKEKVVLWYNRSIYSWHCDLNIKSKDAFNV